MRQVSHLVLYTIQLNSGVYIRHLRACRGISGPCKRFAAPCWRYPATVAAHRDKSRCVLASLVLSVTAWLKAKLCLPYAP